MEFRNLWPSGGLVMTFVLALSGVAASVGEYRNQPLANWLFVLAGLVLLVWLILEFWCGKWRWRLKRPLSFELSARVLPGLEAAQPRSPRFALLKVQNDSRENIENLLARLHYRATVDGKEREWTQDGCWSRETGQDFVQGGGHRVTLTPGDSCLLALAIAVEDIRSWGRVNPDVLARVPATSSSGGIIPMVSGSDEVTLGPRGRVSVEFLAAGFRQVEGFTLDFDEGPLAFSPQ